MSNSPLSYIQPISLQLLYENAARIHSDIEIIEKRVRLYTDEYFSYEDLQELQRHKELNKTILSRLKEEFSLDDAMDEAALQEGKERIIYKIIDSLPLDKKYFIEREMKASDLKQPVLFKADSGYAISNSKLSVDELSSIYNDSGQPNQFYRSGNVWIMRFKNKNQFPMKGIIGYDYIHYLLSRPDTGFSPTNLWIEIKPAVKKDNEDKGESKKDDADEQDEIVGIVETGYGADKDTRRPTAKQIQKQREGYQEELNEYRQDFKTITEELKEAEENGSNKEVQRCRKIRSLIIKRRKPIENIQQDIQDVITKAKDRAIAVIRKNDKELSDYLFRCIRYSGGVFRYLPDDSPIKWQTEKPTASKHS